MRWVFVTLTLAGVWAVSAASAIAAPTVRWSMSPVAPVYTGEAVTFDGSATTCDVAPCTYSWRDDGPDGPASPNYTLGSGAQMSFTFSQPGTIWARLTVRNASGQRASLMRSFSVLAGPRPTPTPTPSPTPTPTPAPTGDCTTTVTSAAALATAANSAASGATVCLADGTYGAASLNATHTDYVTIQPAPGANPIVTGEWDVRGSYWRIQGLHFRPASRGVVFEPAMNHVQVLHDWFDGGAYQVDSDSLDCTRIGAPACQPEQDAPITDIVVQGNKFSHGTEDAIRPNNFQRYSILENEFTGITESGSHVDGVQTITGGDGLVFERNYSHDNAAQTFFIKDGEVNDLTFVDNLSVRNLKPPAYPNCLTDWSASDLQGAVFEHNTQWQADCGGGFLLEHDGPGAQSTRITVDHNVFDQMNVVDGQNASAVIEDNDVFGRNPWSFAAGPGSTVDPSPPFMNPAADDYRIAGSDRGVTWTPVDFHYGP
jgi:hypothetical protein